MVQTRTTGPFKREISAEQPIFEAGVFTITGFDADLTVTTAITISGDAVATLENLINVGGRKIIITLNSGTWQAAGTAFDNERQNIIDGLNSAQSETTGWNNEVRDKLSVTRLVRTSDTVCTIFLDAKTGYEITADEVITVTVPTSAMATGAGGDGTPDIEVSNVPDFCTIPTDSSLTAGAWVGTCSLIDTAGGEEFAQFEEMGLTDSDDWSDLRTTEEFAGEFNIPEIGFGINTDGGGSYNSRYFQAVKDNVYITTATDTDTFAEVTATELWHVQFFQKLNGDSLNEMGVKISPGTGNACASLETFFTDAGLQVGDNIYLNFTSGKVPV